MPLNNNKFRLLAAIYIESPTEWISTRRHSNRIKKLAQDNEPIGDKTPAGHRQVIIISAQQQEQRNLAEKSTT